MLTKLMLLVILLATSSSDLRAEKRRPVRPDHIQVHATIYDSDGALPPTSFLTGSDDWNSALCGGSCAIYSAPELGTYVLADGGWRLYLSGGTRTFFLAGQPDAWDTGFVFPVPPAGGYYSLNGEIYSDCFDVDGNLVPFTSIGTSAATPSPNTNCSFGLNFNSGTAKYKLVMKSSLPAATAQNGVSIPPTGTATVTCIQVLNGSCVAWNIVPDFTNTTANLYQFAKRGLLYVGQFNNVYGVSVAATSP